MEAGDLEELMSLAAAFSWLEELPKGELQGALHVHERVHGEASVMADLSEEYGIQLAKCRETKAYLKTLVPDHGSVNNPFDMTASSSPTRSDGVALQRFKTWA